MRPTSQPPVARFHNATIMARNLQDTRLRLAAQYAEASQLGTINFDEQIRRRVTSPPFEALTFYAIPTIGTYWLGSQ